MSGTSKIEWTEATWNPITGCTKVSQGCKNCYAERLAPKVFAGQVVEVDTTPPKHPEMKASAFRPRVFTDVLCHPERLDAPLHWVKGRRIFVNSMSDLFHEDVPFQFIADIFAVMACTTRHQYQVLTKRPARMLEFFKWLTLDPVFDYPEQVQPTKVWQQWTPTNGRRGGYDNCGPLWPCENVWLGVSVEDQATADERIPLLLQTPAAMRFISAEPLLGPLNLRLFLTRKQLHPEQVPPLDWVIAGGESGPQARPSHPDWFRSLRDQCAAAQVPFFFKQWGEWSHVVIEAHKFKRDLVQDQLGGYFAMWKVGKKTAGRTLDGHTHEEYPLVQEFPRV